MAVTILIGLWLYDELSFDKSFDNYNNIARVIQNVTINGELQTWKNMPYPLAQELRTNYGQNFKRVSMEVNSGDHMVAYNDKKLTTIGGFFEKDAPDMFSLAMLKGKRHFNDPESVLL